MPAAAGRGANDGPPVARPTCSPACVTSRASVSAAMPRTGSARAASAAIVVTPAASSFATCPRVTFATRKRLSSAASRPSQASRQRQSGQSAQGTGRVGSGAATNRSSRSRIRRA